MRSASNTGLCPPCMVLLIIFLKLSGANVWGMCIYHSTHPYVSVQGKLTSGPFLGM